MQSFLHPHGRGAAPRALHNLSSRPTPLRVDVIDVSAAPSLPLAYREAKSRDYSSPKFVRIDADFRGGGQVAALATVWSASE